MSAWEIFAAVCVTVFICVVLPVFAFFGTGWMSLKKDDEDGDSGS